jgi:hypothetical protein
MLKALLKAIKFGKLIPPQLKDDGAFAGNAIFDTQGLGGVMVLLVPGTVDAAIGSDDDSHALNLVECDTTDGTYTAITGAALSAVIGATDDDKMYGIYVDMSGTRKRYLQIDTPTAGNGTTGCNFCAIALGFPHDMLPKNAAEMGLAELIEAPAISLT